MKTTSSANHEDLLIEGDEFQMNLVEKSDVGELRSLSILNAKISSKKEGIFGSRKQMKHCRNDQTKDMLYSYDWAIVDESNIRPA